MDKVLNFIKENINENDTVVVATSGGPDSMCLLDILVSLKELNLNIICAHVNHNTRVENDNEEALVKEYCEKNHVIFESMKINEKIEKNFEMEARKIRYNFFNKLLKKYNTDILFTAHHGDDLIETILMRINRGSILKGYRGILSINNKKDYKILRPLLYLTKREIINYVNDRNILYAIDQSNESYEHTRNRYRHKIVPELKNENKLAHIKFKEFSDELNLIDNYIEKQLDKLEKELIVDNKIDCIKFNLEDRLIKQKLIERILDKIFDGYLEVITKKHVYNIIDLVNNNISNTVIDLPDNYQAKVEYNYFSIEKKSNEIIEICECDLTDDLDLQYGRFKFVKESSDTSNYCIRLCSKDIKLPLKIRYRKNGDKMIIKNFGHEKKINDIFTDEKIENSKRNFIPLLVDSNDEIIWIPGIKKSYFDKEISENYDIIIKYIKKGGK